ncbi:NYN domain-containing protein [candidate division WOR-3 bacterium]|nr:NYN domain-containing protein [candidate division WOR-3 bacterium]
MNPTNRTGVFIDVQNVQETFERQGKEVRYDAVIRHILTTGNRERESCKFVAFVPFRRDDERRQRLIDALSFQGYRVVAKPVRERPDGTIKANMDIEITLEILSMSDWLDEIVLVTGDGDFVALVDWLSKRGKRVISIGLGRGFTSVELIRACDEYINLDEIEGAVKAQFPNKEWEQPPQGNPPPVL